MTLLERELKRDFLPPAIIRHYIAQQTCWICGKGGWKALPQHLNKKHGLPAAEVREMAYMFKRDRLISEELSESLSKVALAKFGRRRHIPLKGEQMAPKILSAKAKDILSERVTAIRPLAAIAHQKDRKPHYCKICGKLIKTSKPTYCSLNCSKIAWSQAARKAMTPERIELFKSIRQIPTPQQQSHRAQMWWTRFRTLPEAEQRRIWEKGAEKRRKPLVSTVCVVCGKSFDIHPWHLNKIRCCSVHCRRQRQSQLAKNRQWSPESRKRLSVSKTISWAKRKAANKETT